MIPDEEQIDTLKAAKASYEDGLKNEDNEQELAAALNVGTGEAGCCKEELEAVKATKPKSLEIES